MFKQDLPEELLRLLPLDVVTLYTRDLQQYPDLPMVRKLELEQLARQGNEQAKHEIIESALRYTARVAAFYYSAYGHFLHHDSYLDLVQIANLAMLETFERALKADSINGYLRGTVKRVIRQHCLYRSGMIATPKHEEWIAKAPRIESLDAMIGETEWTYHDVVAAFTEVEEEDEQGTASRSHKALDDRLHQRVATLTEKQREVVVRHYGLDGEIPEPLYTISKRLGLGATGAFGRLKLALKKLRRELKDVQTDISDEEEASH
jgi:RNA polymerase sigma factor (sigma-70 family)